MSAVNEESGQELEAVITRIAQTQYQHDQKGVLLARLGQTIATRHRHLRLALGNLKLAEYIDEKLANAVQRLKLPSNPIVQVNSSCDSRNVR